MLNSGFLNTDEREKGMNPVKTIAKKVFANEKE
jgi:hypothetical protein